MSCQIDNNIALQSVPDELQRRIGVHICRCGICSAGATSAFADVVIAAPERCAAVCKWSILQFSAFTLKCKGLILLFSAFTLVCKGLILQFSAFSLVCKGLILQFSAFTLNGKGLILLFSAFTPEGYGAKYLAGSASPRGERIKGTVKARRHAR
jgi:hypothetical protein